MTTDHQAQVDAARDEIKRLAEDMGVELVESAYSAKFGKSESRSLLHAAIDRLAALASAPPAPAPLFMDLKFPEGIAEHEQWRIASVIEAAWKHDPQSLALALWSMPATRTEMEYLPPAPAARETVSEHTQRIGLRQPPQVEILPSDRLIERLCELFHIGTKARAVETILANVENVKRRAECLSAIEQAFFTTTLEWMDDDGEGSDEHQLSWSASPSEYVEQMRSALDDYASKSSPGILLDAVELVESAYSAKFGKSESRSLLHAAIDRLAALASAPPAPAASLYEAIKHGDETHRAWLRNAIDAFYAGEPIPPVAMSAAPAASEPVAEPYDYLAIVQQAIRHAWTGNKKACAAYVELIATKVPKWQAGLLLDWLAVMKDEKEPVYVTLQSTQPPAASSDEQDARRERIAAVDERSSLDEARAALKGEQP